MRKFGYRPKCAIVGHKKCEMRLSHWHTFSRSVRKMFIFLARAGERLTVYLYMNIWNRAALATLLWLTIVKDLHSRMLFQYEIHSDVWPGCEGFLALSVVLWPVAGLNHHFDRCIIVKKISTFTCNVFLLILRSLRTSEYKVGRFWSAVIDDKHTHQRHFVWFLVLHVAVSKPIRFFISFIRCTRKQASAIDRD